MMKRLAEASNDLIRVLGGVRASEVRAFEEEVLECLFEAAEIAVEEERLEPAAVDRIDAVGGFHRLGDR